MKPVLKYPGAKNRLAEWIVSFIPEHAVYLEPYFRSGAVLFNKKRSHIETVNDIDEDVVNFFHILRTKTDDLAELIALTPFARNEYQKAFVLETDDTNMERARKFCVRCWQGIGSSNVYRNGFKSGQQSVSPNPAMSWCGLPDRLKIAAERLKGVQIECLPAVELIKRYNTPDVFIYADPPYMISTRKDHQYKFEMSDQDHIELLETLRKHPGKVLLSGYDNDLYNEMLKGWHKEQKETIAESAQRRTETLWMNYDIRKQIYLF